MLTPIPTTARFCNPGASRLLSARARAATEVGIPRSIRSTLGLIAFCGATFLGSGQSVAELDCEDDYKAFNPCVLQGGMYHVRTPETAPPEGGFPSAILLHDAGGSGREIVEDRRLVDLFTSNGIALIAPDGLRRKNLRFRYSGSTGSRMTGVTDTIRRKETKVSKKKFYMTDSDDNV